MLRLNGVTKKFGGLIAVNDVSMTVDKGQIFGVIGPDGAGKTTLLNLISGIYRCDCGEIFVHGERIDNLKPCEIAKKGVARTFQIPRPFRQLTVFENTLVPGLAVSSAHDMTKMKSRAWELSRF